MAVKKGDENAEADVEARFKEMRISHPQMAGSLIRLHNAWYDKFNGMMGNKSIAEWMSREYPGGLYPTMWKTMAETVAQETGLGDAPFDALYPAFSWVSAPAAGPDGKFNHKGLTQPLTAVVGVVAINHLVWAENLAGGGETAIMVGGATPDQVVRVVPVFFGGLLNKCRGVQVTVTEDGDQARATFTLYGNVFKDVWGPFQEELTTPFLR